MIESIIRLLLKKPKGQSIVYSYLAYRDDRADNLSLIMEPVRRAP